MKGHNPTKPTGYDPEARFHQRTHEKQNGPENELRDSATVKVRKTSKGIFLHANPGFKAGTITVQACDPTTGEVITYILFGRIKPST